MFSGLSCNALLCVTSILAFQYYGQTVVPKYFHELAEMQNVLGFAFVPQYMFSDAKAVSCSTAYI
jgi:hypothetical protein